MFPFFQMAILRWNFSLLLLMVVVGVLGTAVLPVDAIKGPPTPLAKRSKLPSYKRLAIQRGGSATKDTKALTKKPIPVFMPILAAFFYSLSIAFTIPVKDDNPLYVVASTYRCLTSFTSFPLFLGHAKGKLRSIWIRNALGYSPAIGHHGCPWNPAVCM